MSINAGNILHVGGSNVIDRIQSAGLGNPNQAIQTIREVGQFEVVDKIPGEPEFTFTHRDAGRLHRADGVPDRQGRALGRPSPAAPPARPTPRAWSTGGATCAR
jgi:hypothetical protein